MTPTGSRALLLLASLAAIATTAPAIAGDFTTEQCAGIAGVAGKVVKALGKETLSVEFRQSFRNWLGANITCDGPKDIFTPTGADIDAFNTIQSLLLVGSKPISLEKAGLRSVDPMKRAERPVDAVPVRASGVDSPQVN